mmetsp:Transcript_26621/g.45865  ORF Transcript_26621/g.45865 Transcript_26621/m.45865 type:complete len:334 (+) Transcript_26621:774-1775(+)
MPRGHSTRTNLSFRTRNSHITEQQFVRNNSHSSICAVSHTSTFIPLELIVRVHLFVGPWGATTAASVLLVQLRNNRIAHTLEFLQLGLEVFRVGGSVVLLEPLGGFLDGRLDRLLVVRTDLVAQLVVVVDRVLHRVRVLLQRILGVHAVFDLFVFLCEFFSFLNHPLNLLRAQPAFVIRDDNLFLLAGPLVFRLNIQNAVRVDFKSHLNLRHSSRSRWKPRELKLAKKVAILCHGALAFEDLNQDRLLVVSVGGECLRLLGGNDSIAANKLRHDSADGLDTESKRRYIEKENFFCFLPSLSTQDAALNCRAVGNSLVRIYSPRWLLSVEEILE